MKMRHLVLALTVFSIIFCEGWAQNRGRSRYVPEGDEYEGESTRAQRAPPTRSVPVRRQRPTKAPEPQDDEDQPYQPPASTRTRTGARQAPDRGPQYQVAPQVENPAPLNYNIPDEAPQLSTAAPEGRPQGRRRRPKKRRRPQETEVKLPSPVEDQNFKISDKDKKSIEDLIDNDQKRSHPLPVDTSARNAPEKFSPENSYQPDVALWNNNKFEENSADPQANSQYFKPQAAVNRLPEEQPEEIQNTRRYPNLQPQISTGQLPNTRYVPEDSPAALPERGSYVPILPPIRIPSGGSSRLPPEEYPGNRQIEPTRYTAPLDRQLHTANRSPTVPVTVPKEVGRNAAGKPQNALQSQSEVRLPPREQPLLSSNFNRPAAEDYESDEEALHQHEPKEKIKENEDQGFLNPSNRLPNPSEVHYEAVNPDSSYSTYLDEHLDDVPRKRSDVEPVVPIRGPQSPQPSRNLVDPYTAPRRDASRKPQEQTDEPTGRRQSSRGSSTRYETPLQRAGSRYGQPDIPENPPRSSARSRPQNTELDQAARGRGSSRYQDNTADLPTDLRTPPDPRPDSRQVSTRGRVSSRYRPEPAEVAHEAVVPNRRQPVVPNRLVEPVNHETPELPQRNNIRSPVPPRINEASNYEDTGSLRNTLRSRPQYDRDNEETYPSEYEDDEESHYAPNPRQNYAEPRRPEVTRPQFDQAERTPSRPQPHPQVTQNARPVRVQSSPRESPQYQTPQNPRTDRNQQRRQPEYQVPQNPRTDREPSARQAHHEPRNPAQQTRTRHQEPAQQSNQGRHSSGSRFSCPDAYGFFADKVQCDKYYECRNGTAFESLCNDGLAFNEVSAPKYLRCDTLRDVDCSSRPELQEPRSTKNCPRRFGLYPQESDCTKFWNCVDGTATEVQCPPGLVYNDDRATCDWADLVKTSCKTEELVGFTCPEPSVYDLQDGVYTSYPHPDNCQRHFTCIKGQDGVRRPRMLSCSDGLVFDPASSSCARPDDVPGCEDFYGARSRPPKRQSTRQQEPREPEPEELEEPTPRPRRRGSNRRTRN